MWLSMCDDSSLAYIRIVFANSPAISSSGTAARAALLLSGGSKAHHVKIPRKIICLWLNYCFQPIFS